jgi:3-oxo-4,17-pregnadiene-20-carboxyl-CoA hydratase alpha subunit
MITPPLRDGFWEGVRRHELLIRRCVRCGARLHPRRVVCPSCGGEELVWTAAAGRGSVYSVSTVHRAPHPAMQSALPYHIGIVRLEEDVFLFTRFLTSAGEAPEIDSAVEVRFLTVESGRELPVFGPPAK